MLPVSNSRPSGEKIVSWHTVYQGQGPFKKCIWTARCLLLNKHDLIVQNHNYSPRARGWSFLELAWKERPWSVARFGSILTKTHFNQDTSMRPLLHGASEDMSPHLLIRLWGLLSSHLLYIYNVGHYFSVYTAAFWRVSLYQTLMFQTSSWKICSEWNI